MADESPLVGNMSKCRTDTHIHYQLTETDTILTHNKTQTDPPTETSNMFAPAPGVRINNKSLNAIITIPKDVFVLLF